MRLIFFLFLSLFVSNIYAANDILSVEIKGDTVIIWNTAVTENCIFSVDFITNVQDTLITIIEHDTTTNKVTCTCTYDLNIKLTGLAVGSYNVIVYRKYAIEYGNPDSLFYIGELHFNYPGSISGKSKLQHYQSACYYPDHLEEQPPHPAETFLLSAYPNPFNSAITITYSIPQAMYVKLKVFDATGKYITTLHDGFQRRGKHKTELKGSELASGVYYYQLLTDTKKITGKCILLK